MPTWEDIINQVTIPGDGTAISNAKGEWELVFRRIRDAKRFLDDGLADLEAWKGPAGQVYRDNVARIAKTLDQVDTDNSAVVHQLAEAATNMSTAISTIPIPAEMAHFVLEAKENFQLRWELAGFGQNAFADFLGSYYESKWSAAVYSLTPDWLTKWQSELRDWISDQDDKAKDAYEILNGQYQTTSGNMPAGNTMFQPSTLNPTPIPLDTPGGGGMPGGAPGLGDLSGPGTGGLDPYSGNPWDVDGGDPDAELPGTGGLAGVGGGGLSGAGGLGGGGLGGGGLGGGLGGVGSGLTGGGLGGAGGLGGVRGGIGPLTSPVTPGMPGIFGGAGAGAGAGSRSAGTSRTGLMGAGPGVGAHGASGDERSTWLQEDDDIWGTESDAAPPLLK